MSHITVRLFLLWVSAATVLVCGYNGLTHQEGEPAAPGVLVLQSAPTTTAEPTTQKVSAALRLKSKCGALDDKLLFVDNLARMAQVVEPTLSYDQASALASSQLLRDVEERTPPVDVTAISRVATVCVVRHINDENKVVWRVEFPGGKQQEG